MKRIEVTGQLHGIPSPARKKVEAGVRERLLSSGMRLFAARGFDGVPVDAIVADAGVNKRMVYHYFGSKEGLYGMVLARVYEELQALEEKFFAGPEHIMDPEAALAAIVEAYFEYLRGHPMFVRLLLWENLHEGSHLAKVGGAVTKSPMLEHLKRVLAEGERRGVFRKDLDARKVLISLIGLCLVYFSNRHTLSHSVGLDLGAASVLRGAAKHTAALLLGGVGSTTRKSKS